MKKYAPLIFILIVLGLIGKACGPSPCDCAWDMQLYSKLFLPTEADKDKVSDCMELYYKEKDLTPKEDYGNDYYDAYNYFQNHPCHD